MGQGWGLQTVVNTDKKDLYMCFDLGWYYINYKYVSPKCRKIQINKSTMMLFSPKLSNNSNAKDIKINLSYFLCKMAKLKTG